MKKYGFKIKDDISFIQFWNKISYLIDDKEEKYYINICLDENGNPTKKLSKKNLDELLQWKLSENYNRLKNSVVVKALSLKREIVNFRENPKKNWKKFYIDYASKCTVTDYSVVTPFFLLHIGNPIQNPIIDQHVIRAYFFTEKGELRENLEDLSILEKENFEEYENYMKFFHNLINKFKEKSILKACRFVDRALWIYGKHLIIKNY